MTNRRTGPNRAESSRQKTINDLIAGMRRAQLEHGVQRRAVVSRRPRMIGVWLGGC